MEQVQNPQPKPPKLSYAKATQQLAAAHFQHDPVRVAKKTFQEDDMRRIGSDSSYKGEPGIIYSPEETANLAARLKFALVGKTYRQQVIYENCPPYCTSCNHLGHEIPNCIVIHNNEKRQVDMDSKLIGDLLNNKEDIRDLRELINHKRKGKKVVINPTDTASPSTNVGQNAENPLNVVNNKHDDVTKLNAYDIVVANDVSSYPSHIPEPEQPNLQQNSGTGHVAEASLEDSKYGDPLTAALLDRNWETDKTCRKEQQHIHIEALEGKTNGGDQTSQIPMTPNSTPEETPQQNTTSLFRK
ncbi:UNVERIFIED_CONTAM: hypothetical protein Sangu_3166500 [Sesamum angustifolium]|uniref:Uncharacterized protein n=1 Tax=Sesamum angustifolium TaxID=2727405 RepID=A0AAW2JTR9_9LAMI